jgi:hypothetical protein
MTIAVPQAGATDVSPTASTFPFFDALCAADLHPTVTNDLFGPVIGSWRLIVTWFDDFGNQTRSSEGEWHFARILEGRAIQDVWIVPPRSQRDAIDDYEYGTSVRFASVDGTWRSVWLGPTRQLVHTFVARRDGSSIRLEDSDRGDGVMRWEFFNITENTFEWRYIQVRDRARVVQHFSAERM